MPLFKGFQSLKPRHQYKSLDTRTEEEKCCPSCGSSVPSVTSSNRSIHWVLLLVCLSSAFLFFVGITMIIAVDRRQPLSSGGSTTLWFDLILSKRPFTQINWIENEVFVSTDPHDGKWDSTSETEHTPWDDIYRGAWIEIEEPKRYGLSGGLPLNRFYNSTLSPKSEGYVVSMFHQIHCVGELKHMLVEVEKGNPIPSKHHATHCIEYLRQAVLCNGDLTLETPEFVGEQTWSGATGWNVNHQCRDWSVINLFPRPDLKHKKAL